MYTTPYTWILRSAVNRTRLAELRLAVADCTLARSLDQDEKSSGKRHESHAATTREMIIRELQNGKMFGGKGLGDGKCFARGVER